MFGTDYFTRTAVGKSNIFVNKPNETKYFYQDLDSTGGRLNGANRYTVTFAKGQLPPVRGFWSLTLYDDDHFFPPNALNPYPPATGPKKQAGDVGGRGSPPSSRKAGSPGAKKGGERLPRPEGCRFLVVRAPVRAGNRHHHGQVDAPTCGETGVASATASVGGRRRCRSRNTNPAKRFPV